jgi:membrane fusion protein, multidrug efflux system
MHRRIARPHLLIFFLAALTPIFSACGSAQTEEVKREPPPVPVILGEAEARRVELTLDQVGTLSAAQEVTVRAETDGRVVEIAFAEGREVRRGEVLVRLDTEKTRVGIVALEAQIQELNARLHNKVRTLERNRPLLEQKLISRLHFDNLETEIAEIEAQIEQGRANIAREKVLLGYATIRAPFGGVTAARTISPGAYLRAGDPVVTVVDLDPLEISFQVPERFKPRITFDQPVILRVDSYPSREFTGRISFISPMIDVGTRTFQVKAQVDNTDHLLNPGMFARVRVVTEVFEEALIVPWESVIQTESETYIYTIQDDLARKIPVRLGVVTPEWAQLFDAGLSPGDPVILEGKFAVRDGAKVAPKRSAPAGVAKE